MKSAIKIPDPSNIRFIDSYTISHEPIASIDLMERASIVFFNWFIKKFPSRENTIAVFAGTGNNGGDGLAVARWLLKNFYRVDIYLYGDPEKASDDNKINQKKIKNQGKEIFLLKNKGMHHTEGKKYDIIIDALLGSGLDRPLKGDLNNLVDLLNRMPSHRVSIDIPTGLFMEKSSDGTVFKADDLLSFEFPKLPFLLPENHPFIKNWEFKSIGLHPKGIEKAVTNHYFITRNSVVENLSERATFSHKGNYGRALILAGQKGFAGAALLAAKACMKTGCGLLFTHTASNCTPILQLGIPEAICYSDESKNRITTLPDLNGFDAIGCGPGIGTENATAKAVMQLITSSSVPLVLDADALNIISERQAVATIPENSIITPHPGEFKRLFGPVNSDFDQLELQRKMSVKHRIIIVMKGAYTRISCPEGNIYFNSTGNPGMATAGSGDVLTGMITAFSAGGLPPLQAALTGVFMHGLAGDCALKSLARESLLASDIIAHISDAFKSLKNTYE